MSVKWIVSKGSPHCHIYVLSPIENLSYTITLKPEKLLQRSVLKLV